MPCGWIDLVLAYLHLPPDKTLAIDGSESRACRYASLAAGREIKAEEVRDNANQLGRNLERFPMPSEQKVGRLRIGPKDKRLTIIHPLSGQSSELEVGTLEEEKVAAAIKELLDGIDSPKRRFLASWRLLPERLARIGAWYRLLPADLRNPDHTIWHYLDAAAGLKMAISEGDEGALLSFALGPVQSFIEAARSVRDLWAGSMLLSWLTFQGMLPILEAYGPTAILFPSLREIPLVDWWLIEQGLNKVDVPRSEWIRLPCMPNRFLALVPCESGGEQAEDLAERCQLAVRDAWRGLAKSVREEIERSLAKLGEDFSGWVARWDTQIEGFFSVTTAVLPLRQCNEAMIARLFGASNFDEAFPKLAAVRRLAEAIPPGDRPGYDQTSAGRWQAQVEMSARLMEALRAVRHIPPSTRDTPVPGKCSLMGTFEQMGPAKLEESRRFWETMAQCVHIGLDRIRKRERLCGVAIVKRFAPHFLAQKLKIDERLLRTPDTATVAATRWLKEACDRGYELDPEAIRERYDVWSGQWLFWTRKDQGQDEDEDAVPDDVWEEIQKARKDKSLGPPPTYYAILMMDGDWMGRWLSGEMAPPIENVLHPETLSYFRQLNDPGAEAALRAPRPLGLVDHAVMSQALTNFALFVVPKIVKEHHGTLIYAGGDDVLAMLPASTAVACARTLRLAFSGDPRVNGGARPGYYRLGNRELLMMGPRATSSCGIAVIHYKEDLRFALQQARRAEKAAKRAGRNLLQIAICRRSGEHTSVLCPWDFVPTVERWVQAFLKGASDRWTYRLRAELKTLAAISREAVRAELSRLVERSEQSTKDLLSESENISAGQMLVRQFDDYLSQLLAPPRSLDEEQAMEGFVHLCQAASFLARGRTE